MWCEPLPSAGRHPLPRLDASKGTDRALPLHRRRATVGCSSGGRPDMPPRRPRRLPKPYEFQRTEECLSRSRQELSVPANHGSNSCWIVRTCHLTGRLEATVSSDNYSCVAGNSIMALERTASLSIARVTRSGSLRCPPDGGFSPLSSQLSANGLPLRDVARAFKDISPVGDVPFSRSIMSCRKPAPDIQ